MRRARALFLALTTVVATLLPVASSTFTGTAANAANAASKPRTAVEGRIAFVRHNQVFTMGPAGNRVVKLTSAGKNYRPQWSPDGRRISYIHEAGGQRDVWVMNAFGGAKRAVTTTGDVSSAGAPWSPDGQTLAFSSPVDDFGVFIDALQLVSSTDLSPTPVVATGYPTGGECGGPIGEPGDPLPTLFVDTHLAWSPAAGGSRIAVKTSDCRFDYSIAMFHVATGEFEQVLAGGSDCCGYAEWTDFFFGPSGEFGYTDQDLGEFGDEIGPRVIVYPGFDSRNGDTGGAPSPSGSFMAFTHKAGASKARVMRARIDGTHRTRLTIGYQPDWRPMP